MPEYTPPGDYTEEVPFRPRSIDGVETSIALLLGETLVGPMEPQLLTSLEQFDQVYGGSSPGDFVREAVEGYFLNGGRRIYVARLDRSGSDLSEVEDVERALALSETTQMRDISLVYRPNASLEIARVLIAHCERRRDRFCVLDAPPTIDIGTFDPRTVYSQTQWAGLYYPWIEIDDSGSSRFVPPGGHVLGIFNRTDAERGVFKAPANEIVRGATGLSDYVNDRDQEVVNPLGVNVIRQFAGRGIRVWGARTLATSSEYKYVPGRRYGTYLETSIRRGLDWVASEPNNEQLWSSVRLIVSAFLTKEWLAGGLVGRTADEALSVHCGKLTTSQDDIAAGKVTVQIGVALTRPTELVAMKIGLQALPPDIAQ